MGERLSPESEDDAATIARLLRFLRAFSTSADPTGPDLYRELQEKFTNDVSEHLITAINKDLEDVIARSNRDFDFSAQQQLSFLSERRSENILIATALMSIKNRLLVVMALQLVVTIALLVFIAFSSWDVNLSNGVDAIDSQKPTISYASSSYDKYDIAKTS